MNTLAKAVEFLEAFEAQSLLDERESVGIATDEATYFEAARKTAKAAHDFRAALPPTFTAEEVEMAEAPWSYLAPTVKESLTHEGTPPVAAPALEWSEAPVRTQWGEGMRCAYVELSKDATLKLYAHVDELHLVPKALHNLCHRDPLIDGYPLTAGLPPPAAAAQAQRMCEWTNCPTRVGDVCCNERAAQPVAAPAQPQCWCDQQGIGAPGVSCGDCPTRDYKQPSAQPVAGEQDARPSRADLIAALKFYADGLHFDKASPDKWDTVSGEPQNWWCDEAGTATIEDGSIAAMTLAGKLNAEQINAMDEGEECDAARVLNKRHAELCNVNEADSWAIQGSDFIEDARAAIAAADAALAARPEPPGDDYHLVWVKNFGALCDALDRATRKGYMPDAMADAWEEFDYRAAQPVAAPARPLTECADNDSPWLVCEPCAAAGKCAKAQPVAEQDALDAARWRHVWQCVMIAQHGEYVLMPDDPTGLPEDSIARSRFVREVDAAIDAARGAAPAQPPTKKITSPPGVDVPSAYDLSRRPGWSRGAA